MIHSTYIKPQTVKSILYLLKHTHTPVPSRPVPSRPAHQPPRSPSRSISSNATAAIVAVAAMANDDPTSEPRHTKYPAHRHDPIPALNQSYDAMRANTARAVAASSSSRLSTSSLRARVRTLVDATRRPAFGMTRRVVIVAFVAVRVVVDAIARVCDDERDARCIVCAVAPRRLVISTRAMATTGVARCSRGRGRVVAVMLALMLAVTVGVARATETTTEARETAIEMRAGAVEGYLAQASANAVIAAKFYAPWCGHCKRLAPVWDEFARASAAEGVVVLSVDASGVGAKALNEKFNIKAFPTILFFNDAKVHEYTGARTLEAFREYVKHRPLRRNAYARGYAVDETTNAVVFEKPSKLLIVRELVRSTSKEIFHFAHAKPAVVLSVFIVGVWAGAFSVAAAFFLVGDYAAAKNWRDFIEHQSRRRAQLEKQK